MNQRKLQEDLRVPAFLGERKEGDTSGRAVALEDEDGRIRRVLVDGLPQVRHRAASRL